MEREIRQFIAICHQPLLVVQSVRYETVCAYIDGYDSALHGGLLVGFRHWLLSCDSERTNLPWWALVRRRVFVGVSPDAPLSEADSQLALAELASCLDMFMQCVITGGLESVFDRYNKWLLSLSSTRFG